MNELKNKMSLEKDVDVDFKVDLSKPIETENKEVEEIKEVEEVEKEVVEEDSKVNDTLVEETSVEEPVSLSKEDLINQYLTDKYEIGVDDLEKVLSQKGSVQSLPEEVENYLQFKSETKRGLKDFIKAQEDYSEYDDAFILKEYYKQNNPELDDSDIDYLVNDKYEVNDVQDTSLDAKRKSFEKKQELNKAKEYFNSLKEKYKSPLESSSDAIPEKAKDAMEFYRLHNENTEKEQAIIQNQREIFEKKTSDLFTKNFKGFEFKIGEKSLHYQPSDIDKVKETQSNLNNFINKFLDDDGLLKDANEYHTALSMAMNPDAYAKFFYEQGKADSVRDVVKDGKNIKMSVRSNVDSNTTGPKFRVMKDSTNFGTGLKIKRK